MRFERPSSLAAIDLRSLAAFRIMLGALIVWDHFHALLDAGLFFSDDGVLPRSLLFSTFQPGESQWSLHVIGGSVLIQSLFMITAMTAGVAVMLGWRTRRALFVAWLLLVSLHSRNPAVLFGGDTVLRVMAFWGLFLPLGACWSLESRNRIVRELNPHLSTGSLAILLQVAMIYWFTAALKYGNEWTRDHSAVYYVLMADQFVRTPGLWLLPHDSLCRWLSIGVWWLEMLGPFAVFIPWRPAMLRTVLIFFMWLMHLGFAICLRIGFFPVAMMMLWSLFIPSSVWDRIRRLDLLLPLEERWTWRQTLAQSFSMMCLVLVLIWNLWTLNPERWKQWMLPQIVSIMNLLRLDQNWSLFAPTPITDDGWMILDAELYDGSHIDLLRGGKPVNFDKPARISSEYPNWRWHKFEVNLVADHYAPMRARFGDCLARQWSQSHPRVRNWTLWFMREETLPHHVVPAPQKVELARNPMFVTK